MTCYVFKTFITEGGDHVFDLWYRTLLPEAQAKFDTRIEYLRDTPAHQWNPKCAKHLTDSDGIYEIRFHADRIQYRPLGFFGPKRQDFTLAFPATEKGDKFVPKDAIEHAETRKKIVLKDHQRACICKFEDED